MSDEKQVANISRIDEDHETTTKSEIEHTGQEATDKEAKLIIDQAIEKLARANESMSSEAEGKNDQPKFLSEEKETNVDEENEVMSKVKTGQMVSESDSKDDENIEADLESDKQKFPSEQNAPNVEENEVKSNVNIGQMVSGNDFKHDEDMCIDGAVVGSGKQNYPSEQNAANVDKEYDEVGLALEKDLKDDEDMWGKPGVKNGGNYLPSSSNSIFFQNKQKTLNTNEKQAPKRRISETVIEISDSESNDSSVCHINSYLASPTEAKRIRGDYSTDSDSSDSCTSEEGDTKVLPMKLDLTPLGLIALNTRASRLDEPKFNECFLSESIEKYFRNSWNNNEPFTGTNLELHMEPFKFCILEKFLSDENIINNIIDDIYTLDWTRKKMDLYEYHQTSDLANLSWQRSIKGVYDLLKSNVMPWVAKLTGIELTNISTSCSFYGTGDYLLTHDDMLGDRRIAFILYLLPWDIKNQGAKCIAQTPGCTDPEQNGESSTKNGLNVNKNIKGWSEHLGGSLELLSVDANNDPVEVVKRLIPTNNMFTFFEVSKKSFHQVEEVVSYDFPRLTINGWFHGPSQQSEDVQSKNTEKPARESITPHRNVVSLDTWITAQYLLPRTKFQIQQQIENASEISLEKFLKQNQYESLLGALNEESLEWKCIGPPNLRKYDILPTSAIDDLPVENPLRSFTQLLTSLIFSKMLLECTDLNVKAYNSISVQRWSSGCYSVLPPKEEYSHTDLDLVMYLGCNENEPCGGGSTVYIAPEEANSDPLVTLEPRNNALNIIYADEATTKFTRYVSRLARRQKPFYIIRCTYGE